MANLDSRIFATILCESAEKGLSDCRGNVEHEQYNTIIEFECSHA
jgi:hypothetical protein